MIKYSLSTIITITCTFIFILSGIYVFIHYKMLDTQPIPKTLPGVEISMQYDLLQKTRSSQSKTEDVQIVIEHKDITGLKEIILDHQMLKRSKFSQKSTSIVTTP